MSQVLHLTYKSSLTRICERNSSFDTGVLRVAYKDENRNGSFIAKDVFEKCIATIFNCPIVCHYIRETDSIGGHDIEFVSDDDGNVRIVNATVPLGVVPESAKYYWETVTEDDGKEHEYLCVEVLLWKRQEAYRKVKEDGIVAQSMEINVNRGRRENGLYIIEDFEFTALCLLGDGIEPCFESAALELFSLDGFKREMTEMMSDLKEDLSMVNARYGVDINPQKNLTEGGEEQLEKKMELLAKFGLSAEQVDFDLDAMSLEQLEEELNKFQTEHSENESQQKDGTEGGETENPDGVQDGGGRQDGDRGNEQYALTGEQFREELINALGAEKIISIWGDEISRYMYWDYDSEASEVYCYDMEDWKLYGFKYSMNGDHVVIDFNSKTRKKFSIVDFDEGEADFTYRAMFEVMINSAVAAKTAELNAQFEADKAKLEEKYNAASETIKQQNTELSELRQYQQSKLNEERTAEIDAVFAVFTDLNGIEAFETLRENCADMSVSDIEEKCYALRGRNGTMAFSKQSAKAPRLPVERHDVGGTGGADEPYGGLFLEFPPTI